MALYSLGNSGRFLNEEWHEKRQEAREGLGAFEYGPSDTVRYDLDELKFDRKARTVTSDPRLEGEGSPKSGHILYKPGYMRKG